MDRQSDEYSLSDDAVAGQASSYDRDSTPTSDPRDSIAKAAEELQETNTNTNNKSNAEFSPLEISPANTEISKHSELEGLSTTDVEKPASQVKTYMGVSKKTKSTAEGTKTETKKVFAGMDKRKDVMPGARQRELQQEGKLPTPTFNPESR